MVVGAQDQRKGPLQRYRRPSGPGHQQRSVEGRVREQYWPGTLMAFGIFTVLATVIFVGPRTFIENGKMFRWFALFAFVGNLLPYAHSGLRWGMARLEWLLFNLLAVGPLVLSAALVLNLLVHGPERMYLVHGMPYRSSVPAYWNLHGELPSNTPLNPDGAPFEGIRPEQAALTDHLLGVADGCLGYPVVTRWSRVRIEEAE